MKTTKMNASEKPSTKSQGDHLPWYLKENNHILQDKEDSIDSTGNSYILQYTRYRTMATAGKASETVAAQDACVGERY